MLTEYLQDRAALYVTGGMSEDEREEFELLLEFHEELRESVAALSEAGAAVLLSARAQDVQPSPTLRARIMDSIRGRRQQNRHEALVVASPDGLVHWVSPEFTEMCGYALQELRGKKLGPILQGAKTDRATAERMRHAVLERRECRERILNYHKDGSAYWVDIDIKPIRDDAGTPIYLVAREREVPDVAAA
jgi:PAS domain S-box-containing protein